jgi:hypothetical protein
MVIVRRVIVRIVVTARTVIVRNGHMVTARKVIALSAHMVIVRRVIVRIVATVPMVTVHRARMVIVRRVIVPSVPMVIVRRVIGPTVDTVLPLRQVPRPAVREVGVVTATTVAGTAMIVVRHRDAWIGRRVRLDRLSPMTSLVAS